MKQYGKLDLRNCDCMDLMKEYEDNHFDLAIVDPPYFQGPNKPGFYRNGKYSSTLVPAGDYGELKYWLVPDEEYFRSLARVSKNQIIWGANHFANKVSIESPCWIIWDKQNDASSFADAELAYSTFKTSARIFRYKWCGMLQGDMKNKETRIHPTQKPVALYKWLLHNYAKQGDKILDTHLGSGSIAIACHYVGFNLTGSELDTDYYQVMMERIERETAQEELF